MTHNSYTLRCDKCSKCMGIIRSEDIDTEIMLDTLVDTGKMTALCPDCFVKENDNETN